jgi:pilus assembly protein CpaF
VTIIKSKKNLRDYLNLQEEKKTKKIKVKSIISFDKENETSFNSLCEVVDKYFDEAWTTEVGKDEEATERLRITHRRAIVGYEKDVEVYKNKIEEYLKKGGLEKSWFPEWYENLVDAIFHEIWGLAGIQAWKQMKKSEACKIVGERIYFEVDGKKVLQKQRISYKRQRQLRRALILEEKNTSEHEDFSEVYQLDGTRIKIFHESAAKEATIVFRNYTIKQPKFEDLSNKERNTFPMEMIPLLKAMVRVGYNVNFMGPVKSGKTTFLQAWQSYENPELEGVLIETDPEIPMHLIMPTAPILQLVLEDERLKKIMKEVKRSDADYVIVAEARDAIALYIGLEATQIGTRRSKMSWHGSFATSFSYDAAESVSQVFGGDPLNIMLKFARGFHYIYEFCSLRSDKTQKRLKGIYEQRYNPKTYEFSIHQILKYDFLSDSWTFKYDIGEDKREIAYEEDYEAFKIFDSELKRLAEKYPMTGNEDEHITVPVQTKFMFNR